MKVASAKTRDAELRGLAEIDQVRFAGAEPHDPHGEPPKAEISLATPRL